jgi:hypothetical protein
VERQVARAVVAVPDLLAHLVPLHGACSIPFSLLSFLSPLLFFCPSPLSPLPSLRSLLPPLSSPLSLASPSSLVFYRSRVSSLSPILSLLYPPPRGDAALTVGALGCRSCNLRPNGKLGGSRIGYPPAAHWEPKWPQMRLGATLRRACVACGVCGLVAYLRVRPQGPSGSSG